LGPFQISTKIRGGDIRNFVIIAGVNNTGDKLFISVNINGDVLLLLHQRWNSVNNISLTTPQSEHKVKNHHKSENSPSKRGGLTVPISTHFPQKYNFKTHVHRKKKFTSFPSPAGMSLTKLPRAGIIQL
jgi:hypothetical protein